MFSYPTIYLFNFHNNCSTLALLSHFKAFKVKNIFFLFKLRLNFGHYLNCVFFKWWEGRSLDINYRNHEMKNRRKLGAICCLDFLIY